MGETPPKQKQSIQETLAVFPTLRKRIADSVRVLEEQIEAGQESGGAAEEGKEKEEEMRRAKEVVAEARRVLDAAGGEKGEESR